MVESVVMTTTLILVMGGYGVMGINYARIQSENNQLRRELEIARRAYSDLRKY